MTAEDCRRKAAEWLKAAQTVADPKTIETMHRVSNLWDTLAQSVERTNSTAAHFNSLAKRPADLATRPTLRRTETVQAADILRERLRLNREPIEDTSQ